MKHNNICQGTVIIYLNPSIQFLATSQFGRDCVSVSSILVKTIDSFAHFFCVDCNKEITEEDVLFVCKDCGKAFPKKFLLTLPFGGIACTDCCKKYEYNSLSPLPNKFRIK